MKRIVTLLTAVAAAIVLAIPAEAATHCRELRLTKDCTGYDFTAGSSCIVRSSNIGAIRPGSRIVYRSALGDPTPGVLDSDLVIYGPGHNDAFGHVVLDGATLTGVVTLSGGTGRFVHFHAGPLQVACPDYPICTWTGPIGSPHRSPTR
jgi:hypothetical protein